MNQQYKPRDARWISGAPKYSPMRDYIARLMPFIWRCKSCGWWIKAWTNTSLDQARREHSCR